MTPEEQSRFLYLRRLDADYNNRIDFEFRNIISWEMLIKQARENISNYRVEIESYSTELLDLQAKSDYENDTAAEDYLKSKQ